jgi:glutamate formiminotransferase / formiminotetrahydrofolate cyclodeaminase
MNNRAIIECVPNFSEGRDPAIIDKITDEIKAVEGVKLLDVDPGKATNRTVVTFVGAPEPVIEAAFRAIKKAAELIDMSKHSGEHPRMGATDVCPLIPVSGISMEEVIQYAHKLGKKVGEELNIPGYFYEEAATKPERKNLATVRAGEYEGLSKKLVDPQWKPDFGPAAFNAKTGATAVGARDFLVAYNINLNTKSVRRANSVAFDVREKGRVQREGDPVTGKIVTDENGEPVRTPGTCKGVKAIGWYIEEYGVAQISMNITNINQTALHEAFEACRQSANSRGMRVTGSELVGLVPKKVMIDAGKYFIQQQQLSTGVSEEELIHIAIKSMGLDELGPFDPRKKIIEYMIEDDQSAQLVGMNLREFANETASDSPAPGGGSISAYAGSLGAALATMVANLSAHKRGYEDRFEYFVNHAEKGQELKDRLLFLVDEDTRAFNGIIDAVRLPKSNDEEKAARKQAMTEATKYAIEVPYQVMQTAAEVLPLAKEMVLNGNPNSKSDAGVAALCGLAAVKGAYMNVMINCKDLDDKSYVDDIRQKAKTLLNQCEAWAEEIEREMMNSLEA